MNWRRLRTLMLREVRATFRSVFTVTVLIAVPIAALMVFGFVLSTEITGLTLGLLDGSQTPASRELIAELTAKGTFKPYHYATREELERGLVGGEISAAIIIPPAFGRGARGPGNAESPQLQVLYDGGEAVLAGNAEGFLRSMVGLNGATIITQAIKPSMPVSTPGVHVVTRALFNPKLAGAPFMVSGTFGFVLSFLTVLLTAVSIVNERLTGTFEQLQVTPATGVEILLGKILPLGAIFTFDVILMVLLAGFVLHVWPQGSALFFVVVSAFYVLVSLAMGVIISASSATAAEAVQKSVMLSIPLVQLSGFAFPTRNMPMAVQWFSEIFPATHYIRLARAIYIRAEGPSDLMFELFLLGIFGALLVRAALRSIEARA